MRSSAAFIAGLYANPDDCDRYGMNGSHFRSSSSRRKYHTSTPSTSTGRSVGTSRSSSRFAFVVTTVTWWPRRTSISAAAETEAIGPPILYAGL